MEISRLLHNWYCVNKRNLPWRKHSSPYHIWLSEIILQQTRVEQGLDYYNRFIEKFPTVHDLANASLDDVLKMWQGLGYYTRARNLHDTAKVITCQYQGRFPEEYDELLRLKGIGKYTAAAIASIAFRKPVALVDGNVFRVIARLYGITAPLNRLNGGKRCNELAVSLLDIDHPDIHNQAMMEFGALICTPRNPKCPDCVLAGFCFALKNNMTETLPLKKDKTRKKERYFNYLFLVCDGMTLLRRREEKDIWNSLYEFPMMETGSSVSLRELLTKKPFCSLNNSSVSSNGHEPFIYNHQLTHQVLHCSFYMLKVSRLPDWTDNQYFSIPLEKLQTFAIPRVIDRFLADLDRKGIR